MLARNNGEIVTAGNERSAMGKSNSIDPNILLQKAIQYRQSGKLKEAAELYGELLDLYPNHAPLLTELGTIKLYLGNSVDGVRLLFQSLREEPRQPLALSNLSVGLRALRCFDEALASCDKAIALQPNNPDAFNNKGLVLSELRRHDQALACFDRVIALSPNHADAYANRGALLQEIKKYADALASYEKAYSINPGLDWLFGARLSMKLHTCNWDKIEEQCKTLRKKIGCGEKVSEPFIVLGALDDPSAQKRAAEIYVQSKYPAQHGPAPISVPSRRNKICLAYFSADFHAHATAYLAAELFEKHDKNRFELIAFSFGPDEKDDMRKRIRAAFDRFVDVSAKSDVEVAAMARKMGVDIAVDLKGFTQGARPGIFAARAAPIQVSYLGYPGTMGASYMDYLIADSTLIPAENRQNFTEKIVYLPYSYQVNDSQRKIADRQFSREEVGLPEKGFVFCCFNNNYKILPDTFGIWMRILRQVEGSVLWLFEDTPDVVRHLRREALRAGVAEERIIFAKRMALPEHLARHQLADLFLDTFPYNAHTTASDALWAGLPVLTRLGDAFAGRVAASLLNAVGLPELVTTSKDEYERLALRLATEEGLLSSIKDKLAANRLRSPLFNIDTFARHVETAYERMYKIGLERKTPEDIYVQS